MIRVRAAVVSALMAGTWACGVAQTAAPLPKIVEKDGRYALMVDGAPFLILGAQVNNSSAWPSTLPKVWPTVEAMGINTLEAPVYWEQFEPQKGHYDTTVVHALLEQARSHHVHLVLLWFGLFKNGSGHYTPEWIKRDEEHVPHVVTKDGGKVDSLAAKTQMGLQADRAAFVQLMTYLKANDARRTVLMIQVQNEAGTYGSVRDYGADSNALFAGPVPSALTAALRKPTGTWTEVFGKDADESFQTYEVANYINEVAKAGKAVYPLPMYCNVATRDPFHPSPGSWPSGSATDAMIPIWKAVATSIDALGPDVYTPAYATYEKMLEVYHRPDNAMLVPESGNAPEYARYLFDVVGHQGIGFATFGMDATGYVNVPLGADKVNAETIAPFAVAYHLVGSMDRVIAKLSFEGHVQGVAEDPSVAAQTMSFPRWKVKASWGLGQFGGTSWIKAKRATPPDGGAIVAALGPDEFLVTGVHVRLEFEPEETGKQVQYIRVEEGHYEAGVWHFDRIWNGDQTDYGLNFTEMQQVLKVTLATY